jgi:hypothetical protein
MAGEIYTACEKIRKKEDRAAIAALVDVVSCFATESYCARRWDRLRRYRIRSLLKHLDRSRTLLRDASALARRRTT